jgi:hypothetical protein
MQKTEWDMSTKKLFQMQHIAHNQLNERPLDNLAIVSLMRQNLTEPNHPRPHRRSDQQPPQEKLVPPGPPTAHRQRTISAFPRLPPTVQMRSSKR